jgi:hypothetical protein
VEAETYPASDETLVPVFVTVAVRTSAGAGIGPKLVPPDEAGRLVRSKHAVYGSTAPRGLRGRRRERFGEWVYLPRRYRMPELIRRGPEWPW